MHMVRAFKVLRMVVPVMKGTTVHLCSKKGLHLSISKEPWKTGEWCDTTGPEQASRAMWLRRFVIHPLKQTSCTWAVSSPKLAELKSFKVTAVMCARVFGILIRALHYCVGELPGPIHYSGECERYLLPRLLSLWDGGEREEDEKMKIEKQREN